MRTELLRAALLAGVLAFAMPAGLSAQTDGDDAATPPPSSGPEVNTNTADDTQPAVDAEENEGCPTGGLGTDESTAGTDGTAEGTDADLTNCAEKEPTDDPAGEGTDGGGDQGGDSGEPEQQGSDDAGTNTGG